MNRYIGIARERKEPWYKINVMLYNRMIVLTLYTPRTKRPKCYYYGKKEFYYCVDDANVIDLKWFFGVSINKDY